MLKITPCNRMNKVNYPNFKRMDCRRICASDYQASLADFINYWDGLGQLWYNLFVISLNL